MKSFQKALNGALTLLLSAAMILSGCHAPQAPSIPPASSSAAASSPAQIPLEVLSREDAARQLAQAASHYSTITEEALLSSLELQGRAPDPAGAVTRIELLVMLSTAFGNLPAPSISAIYSNPIELTFTDLPDWAEPSVENLIQAGLLTGQETGGDQALLCPDDPVDRQELERMIRRIYAYAGLREQDDFWACSTRRWRTATSIFSGYGIETPSVQLSRRTISQVASDIAALSQRTGLEPGSDEEKIANFFNCIMDDDSRNKAGNEPLSPYISAFSNAQTLDQLLEALYQCFDETGITLLYDFTPTVDNRDSRRYRLSFTYVGLSLNKDSLTAPVDQTLVDGLNDYLCTLFLFAGFSKREAQERAQQVVDFNLKMAPLEWDPEEEYDVDKIYNLYSMEQLQLLFPSVDLDKIRQVQGYREKDTASVLVANPATLEFFASKCTEENLELLKSLSIANLVGGCSAFLTTELNETAHDFRNLYTGTTGNPTLEEYANYYTRNVLAGEVNRCYAQTYCSAEDKAQVAAMIQEMIEIFRQRIDKLSWMSGATKENAKKKLDTMRIQVGYPDSWDDSFAEAAVLPPKQGENMLIENIFSFYRHSASMMPGLLDEEVDKDSWGSDLMTVNAYYNPICNSITVPAGSLQSPFYDANAAIEQNLAGIGFFIAHEITHCFDDNGAKYDQDGNAANWWTSEDYEAFQTLCQQTVGYYDGFETAPGIAVNGQRTLSENIADLGSMACLLDYLQELPAPDYEAFFHAFAGCWASNSLRSYLKYLSTEDVHSFDNVRVNRVLSAYQQFYDTFDVTPGDGMYVPPGDRPLIW